MGSGINLAAGHFRQAHIDHQWIAIVAGCCESQWIGAEDTLIPAPGGARDRPVAEAERDQSLAGQRLHLVPGDAGVM